MNPDQPWPLKIDLDLQERLKKIWEDSGRGTNSNGVPTIFGPAILYSSDYKDILINSFNPTAESTKEVLMEPDASKPPAPLPPTPQIDYSLISRIKEMHYAIQCRIPKSIVVTFENDDLNRKVRFIFRHWETEYHPIEEGQELSTYQKEYVLKMSYSHKELCTNGSRNWIERHIPDRLIQEFRKLGTCEL